MGSMFDDEKWRVLHDGHVGMQTMRYPRRVWRILEKFGMLKERWVKCDVWQKHQDALRSRKLSSLNRFAKAREALGLDYIGSIDGKYILVKIYYFNKLIELDGGEQANTKHTLAGIEKWEDSMGSVATIITDGAEHFDNAEVKRWVNQ